MVVKLLTQTEWVKNNRKFMMGRNYVVKGQSKDPSNGRKNYLIEDRNGKPIVFYENEFEVIKP